MSEHRARIIASQWLIHIAELELAEALTAEALRTLRLQAPNDAIAGASSKPTRREARRQ